MMGKFPTNVGIVLRRWEIQYCVFAKKMREILYFQMRDWLYLFHTNGLYIFGNWRELYVASRWSIHPYLTNCVDSVSWGHAQAIHHVAASHVTSTVNTVSAMDDNDVLAVFHLLLVLLRLSLGQRRHVGWRHIRLKILLKWTRNKTWISHLCSLKDSTAF